MRVNIAKKGEGGRGNEVRREERMEGEREGGEGRGREDAGERGPMSGRNGYVAGGIFRCYRLSRG